MIKTVCWVLIFPGVLLSSEFTAGLQAYNAKDYPGAIQHLSLAAQETPQLSDYIVYYLASARNLSGDAAGARRELLAFAGPSPLASKAALLSAQAALQLHDAQSAIQILRKAYATLSQPEGDLLLAQSYEAQGERLQAAALYQRVFYLHPANPEATAASGAIDRLKLALGKDYPPPLAQQVLARAAVWLSTRNYATARAEYAGMHLLGLERDQAQVRIAAVDYLSGNVTAAKSALDRLRLAPSEADAERLFYLVEVARKQSSDAAMNTAIDALAKHYPESPWRLKALLSAGNRYLLTHDAARYTPLFTAAYQTFPPDASTAQAHWKIAWDAYLKRSVSARLLLEEQVSKYPTDTRAASALYFLGRLAEDAEDFSAARNAYGALARAFPNYWYGVLAEGKLHQKAIASAPLPSASWKLPAVSDWNAERPTAATTAHIERARLLKAASLPDWAQAELRFGIATDGQRRLLAIELASEDATPAEALRHMKSLTPEYLSVPIENAPSDFWHFLFPLPYRDELTAHAKAQGIDPYLLAGLIRQESEFNPAAVSRANALGLTQLIPGTGRLMAKGQGMAVFRSGLLFHPDVSLQLGAAYLKTQLTLWNGNLEQTLAAYNAGPGRVREWLAWQNYREPAEFVESIPFTETREYVQAVLRNAAIYKRLYDGHHA